MATPKQKSKSPVAQPDLVEYRNWLVSAEQKSQESFDKTVLTLSGGALGVSFVFLKDVVGANPVVSPGWLLASWIAWGTSTLAVLGSFYVSHLALRRAIAQVDDGTIYMSPPGGWWSRATAILNAASAALFLAGVVAITTFVGRNLPTEENESVIQEATQPPKPAHEEPAASNPATTPTIDPTTAKPATD